jgi:hypothetical protein
MIKLKKVFKLLVYPFRLIKKAFGDWINTSPRMSAGWIRRHRLEQFKARNGCYK